jgi:hypothetical protein
MPCRRKEKKQKPAPIRGDKISFVTGSYAGEVGWINTALPGTKLLAHVILDGGQGPGNNVNFTTTVRKTSLAPYEEDPKNVEAMVVQMDPKVAFHLASLSRALAECGQDATDELMDIIKASIITANLLQLEKGKKAKYSEAALFLAPLRKQQESAMQS